MNSSSGAPVSSLDHSRIPVLDRLTGKHHPLAFDKPNGTWVPTLPGRAGWKYPTPPSKGGVTEDRLGVRIEDPWRELEDLESDDTQRFMREQNELSKPFLRSHPLRSQLEQVVHHSYSYERTSCPMLQGDGYYYWLYNRGDWARDIMVRSKDLKRDFEQAPSSLTANTNGATNGHSTGPELIFDPNAEEHISLYAYSWSPCGRYWTAILQGSGSDWQSIRTFDTNTAKPVEADLTESKFTFGVSYINSRGFLYKRPIAVASLPATTSDNAFSGADGQFGIYYHHIGTPQAEDVLVWYGKGPEAASLITGRPVVCSADETGNARRWLMWDVYRNTNPETQCMIFELPAALDRMDGAEVGRELARLLRDEVRWISNSFTGETTYCGTLSDDTHLFFSTAEGHIKGRVLSLSAATYDASSPGAVLDLTELVPVDRAGLILQRAHLVADKLLVLVYLKHACAAAVFADARTGVPIGSSDAKGTRDHAHTRPGVHLPVPDEEIENFSHGEHATVIPLHASISAAACRADSNDFYLTVDTFVAPPYVLSGQVYQSSEGPEVKLARLDAIEPEAEDLVCEQAFYPSYDGTLIPLFICHRRDLDISKPNSVLLHAYGGSAVAITPHYSPLFTTYMRHLNGIVAVACIRGGGEYGKEWHDCAVAVNRFVSFEDFSHAARYLQGERRLTTPALTATYGVSNGGLLVAACTNRDPQLFGAVFVDVGVLDLTRFHLFTLGRLWTAEYGDPDDPAVLPFVHAMSPLHNVRASEKVTYPAVLVTTGDHDTRVIPGHSLKYLAELQSKKKGNKNVFLGRIYENAGHESGSKSTEQKVEEAVDRLVFMLAAMPR